MRKQRQLGAWLGVSTTLLLSSCGTGTTTRTDGAESPVDAPPADGVWGWISVIEENDTCNQWSLKTTWHGGVRAFFGQSQSYPRALPQHTDFLAEITREGDCAVFDSGLVSAELLASCVNDPASVWLKVDFECLVEPPLPEDCTASHWCCQDAECRPPVDAHGVGQCVSLAPHWSLGTIVIEGTTTNLTLVPDGYDRYAPTITVPTDLFAGGETITARTSGGALDPIELHASGVHHLELGNAALVDLTAAASRVTWTPSGESARVQVAIYSGSHDPNPVMALLLCDAPDAAGEIQIPSNLRATFLQRTCGGSSFWGQKCSRVTRYTRSTTVTPGGGEIELFVGSARNLLVNWPGN